LQTISFQSGSDINPIHVECFKAATKTQRSIPLLMLHGAFHTGHSYISKPDGQEGWAPWFWRQGRDVYVPDWPGHGQSPAGSEFATLSTMAIAESLGKLVQIIGPVILCAHSAAGPIAWWLAENYSDLVVAVIGIAPGPPGNIQTVLPFDAAAIEKLKHDSTVGCPVFSSEAAAVVVDLPFVKSFWANSPQFPDECVTNYARSIVPESARVLNERFNIGGMALQLTRPELVASRPILILTGECDPRHPKAVDKTLADYFGADFIWLPDQGVFGNGHMLMSERNSDTIAQLIADWLQSKSI